MNDSAIVDLFFARDEGAISECDKKYGAPLLIFGNRITNDPHVSDEALSDTYMSAWQTVPPKDPRDYLFAFLSKLMRTRCIDALRKKTREKRGGGLVLIESELCDTAPAADRADSEADYNELVRLIGEYLKTEREDARHIFVLRYFYMYDVKDIAKRLIVTEGKVKTSLMRSRERLRAFLALYGWGGDLR